MLDTVLLRERTPPLAGEFCSFSLLCILLRRQVYMLSLKLCHMIRHYAGLVIRPTLHTRKC